MRMTGEERIAAPRSRVWDALNDPNILRQAIPGCQSLDRETAEKLRAVVEVKIGPIGARFNCVVTLSNIQPQQSYTLGVEGQGGTVGSGKSDIKVKLADDAGGGTLLSYEVDAQVGGRLAQLGGPLIDATAKQLAGKFFKKFAELIGGAPAAATGTAASAGVSASVPRAVQTTTMPAASAPASSTSAGLPMGWILAVVVAALVGFLIGRGQGANGASDWMGIAIGLLVIIVAAAGFEYGRRTATTQIVLDAASLQRLLRGEKP